MTRPQRYGQDSELNAAEFLRRCGYRIVEQNYRCRYGEIDIIARQADALVFVEVKARQSDRFGGAKAAVTKSKQRKISQVALQYLKSTRQMNRKARFDVVAISGAGPDAKFELVSDAFELAYR